MTDEQTKFHALCDELGAIPLDSTSPRVQEVLAEIRAIAERWDAEGNQEAPRYLSGVYFNTGVRASAVGRGEEADAAYAAAIPFAERALANEPENVSVRERLGSLHYNLGCSCSETGRSVEAEKHYLAAMPYMEANIAAHPEEPGYRNYLAQNHFNLGNSCLELKRNEESVSWFQRAIEIWSRLVEEVPTHVAYGHDLARAHFNVGYVCNNLKRQAEAMEGYQKSQQVWERLLTEFGENLPQRYDLARSYYNLARIFWEQKQENEAAAVSEKALLNSYKLVELAPTHQPFVQLLQDCVKQFAQMVKDPTRATAAYLNEATVLANHPRSRGDFKALHPIAEKLYQHAGATLKAKHPLEAEQLYRAACALAADAAKLDPQPDSAHFEAALWFDFQSDFRNTGWFDVAEEALHAARVRWQRLADAHPNDPRFQNWLPGAFNNLGIIHADTSRLDSAERLYRFAIQLREKYSEVKQDAAQHQLFIGGGYCNLGNLYLDRGKFDEAREHYQKGVDLIEGVRARLKGNNLVGAFLKNCTDGLAKCKDRKPLRELFQGMATATGAQGGPPALQFEVENEDLRNADNLRLASDDNAMSATAALVEKYPTNADAWFLRGLVLGHFMAEKGGVTISWDDDRHIQATAAFYMSLVYRPGFYEALLFKGMALRQAAHSAQARYRLVVGCVEKEKMDKEEREPYLAVWRRRLQQDVARSEQSLKAAQRIRPTEGRALFELVELYDGLGYAKQAKPFLDELETLGGEWWDKAQQRFK